MGLIFVQMRARKARNIVAKETISLEEELNLMVTLYLVTPPTKSVLWLHLQVIWIWVELISTSEDFPSRRCVHPSLNLNFLAVSS